MRTFDEADAAALDRSAFSNGTEWDAWSGTWCGRCEHDKDTPGCPLVLVAMLGKTPAEWLEQPPGEHGPYNSNLYHCVEFRDENTPGEGREPLPIPDPPGQETLLPREPYTGVRMLAQPTPERVA